MKNNQHKRNKAMPKQQAKTKRSLKEKKTMRKQKAKKPTNKEGTQTKPTNKEGTQTKPTNKEGAHTKPTNKEGAQTIANNTRQDPKEKPNRKTIFLTGDSLLSGISENGLQSKHNVKSRPHSGASSEDMVDFIKPYLRKKPDAIILHCGTNDLTKGVD